jgi:hypothetical protein
MFKKSVLVFAFLVPFFADGGCGPEKSSEDNGSTSEALISQAAANKLISDGRAQIGADGGQCKAWVQAVTLASYGVMLPQNDATALYRWTNDTTPAVNVARWLGSYANGRMGPLSLAGGARALMSVSVPNGDPQTIVIYASTSFVTATVSKSGSAALAVTSSGTTGGTVATGTTVGSGTWTLTVTNAGSSTVSGVVVVVLSQSRFSSDWQTARRGDIMQMFVGTSSANRSLAGPHTAFVQTDYNANGTCTVSDSTGCNWLDSNWMAADIVGAHAITMNDMMKMAAYGAAYGFTVYRLN